MSTIMIVEDLAIFREPIEAVLKREGYTTLTARDGAQALAMLSQLAPDLVLLDLGLPGVDGLEVLAQMRRISRLRDVPVIVLSAQADRGRVVAAAKHGVRGYMLKANFSLQQMLESIREQLRGPGERGGREEKAEAEAPGCTGETAAGLEGADRSGGSAGRLDPAEALRSLKPLKTRSDILERIGKFGELKGLAPTVAQVLKLTGNARCSIETVARAISQDHGIALKMLKLANSAVYTRGEPVDSVQKAVVRIGLERIRQAVLNVGVVDHFGGAEALGLGEYLSMEQFWEHSIACGIIAAELAHCTDVPDEADQLFTMGLLHDIGRVVYAQQLPEDYVAVMQEAARLDLPLEQVESRLLLMDHAAIMDRVLRLWNFPPDLINPIVFHHLSAANVRSAAPHQVRQVLRLGLANRLAHAMLLGSSGNESVYPTEDLCAALDLGEDVVRRLERMARAQTDDVKLALLSNSAGASWRPRRDAHREAVGEGFRPLYVSERPGIDAYRILCDQLRSEGDDAPTVAVVHIANARERMSVSNRLRTAEQEAGVTRLPLMVLSPAGKTGVDTSLTEGRAFVNVATPLTVRRFIREVRGLLGEAAGTGSPSP